MREDVVIDGVVHAVIIRNEYAESGVHFFTPPDYSQQLAYMSHPKGKIIDPHHHRAVERSVQRTQEVLVIKRGRLRVDFYDSNDALSQSRELGAGDVILLASGGHGFEVLEDVEMIEIKQGPFLGDDDKVRFKPHE